jgi:F0F1-type ATP synthase assembly protein I
MLLEKCVFVLFCFFFSKQRGEKGRVCFWFLKKEKRLFEICTIIVFVPSIIKCFQVDAFCNA